MGELFIIEDDLLLHEKLTEILGIYWHTVIQAENGEEGLRMFSKVVPDRLICEINMPKMVGFEVLEKIKTVFSKSEFLLLNFYRPNRAKKY